MGALPSFDPVVISAPVEVAAVLARASLFVGVDAASCVVASPVCGVSLSDQKDMLEKQTMTPKKPGHGHKGVVDVVLGAQWGDEGKGKLVRGVRSRRSISGVVLVVRNLQRRTEICRHGLALRSV